MKIKVLHIVSGDGWGGLETMVLDLLCSEIYRTRIDVAVIVLNEGRFASKARSSGLDVVVVSESAMSFSSLSKELKRVTGALRPDVIHTHRYKEILLGALLAGASAAQHVVTIHGYEPPTGCLLRARTFLSNSLCIGAALVQGARFVVVADHLRKRFMIPRSRCLSIRNGIRIPQQVSSRSPIDPADHPKEVVIGWVGRLVPVKGVSTLLKAVAEMSKSQPTPRVLLVGEGPERESLEKLAAALGLSERVRFVGFVEDIWPYYEQMDLFVLPSLHEGVPIALLEALGAGLPVVASAVGGIPHVIGTSEAAVLIDSQSPSTWAEALTGLLSDRAKMTAIGERARKHIEANFSIEGMTEQYLALYQSARATR
jgi:glycosyltransferase involved in cell wall biosynthesis